MPGRGRGTGGTRGAGAAIANAIFTQQIQIGKGRGRGTMRTEEVLRQGIGPRMSWSWLVQLQPEVKSKDNFSLKKLEDEESTGYENVQEESQNSGAGFEPHERFQRDLEETMGVLGRRAGFGRGKVFDEIPSKTLRTPVGNSRNWYNSDSTGSSGTVNSEPIQENQAPFSLWCDVPQDASHGVQVPEGFLHPMAVRIPTTLSDSITPQSTRLCVPPCIYSPSEFFVTFADFWPTELDSFASEMTNFYHALRQVPRRHIYMVHDSMLVRGAIIAVFSRVSRGGEWLRAQVKERVYEGCELSAIKVKLIDIGDDFEVGVIDTAYLHKKFAEKHQLVIPCRIYYQDWGSWHENEWSEKEKSSFFNQLSFTVSKIKFQNRVEKDGGLIWEVSIINGNNMVEDQEYEQRNWKLLCK